MKLIRRKPVIFSCLETVTLGKELSTRGKSSWNWIIDLLYAGQSELKEKNFFNKMVRISLKFWLGSTIGYIVHTKK